MMIRATIMLLTIGFMIPFCAFSQNTKPENLASVNSQVKVLDHLNPDSCDYKFYFLNVRKGEKVNNDSFPDFIIDDKIMIKSFINNWTGHQTDGLYECWYDYFVYIICNQKIVDVLRINYECKQVVSSHHIINFEHHPFLNLPNEKKFSSHDFYFKKIEEAREFVKMATSKTDIFIPDLDIYHWIDYDGKFYIQVVMDLAMKELRAIDYERIIHGKYPNDSIHIEFWGFGENTMQAYIYCKKDFWNRFNLYDKLEWKKLDSTFSVFILGDTKKINELIKTEGSQIDYP